MKTEYLLFNLFVFTGPAVFSFDRQTRFITRWPIALLASGIVMMPYIIWDAAVTGLHWWFNAQYTLDFRLAGLPIEEWLFFITIPFACLFIWEILPSSPQKQRRIVLERIRLGLRLTLPLGIVVFRAGKEYTGLVLICLGVVAFADAWLKTHLLLQLRTYLYLAIIAGLILICNGYLTARPVVLYGAAYQMGVRVFTIPIEDFGYGFTLVLANTMLYEKLKGIRRG